MSLAASGHRDHEVVSKGVEFLAASIREDGSWPIDTNFATWVTTLSINALANCKLRIADCGLNRRPRIRNVVTPDFDPGPQSDNSAEGGRLLPGVVPEIRNQLTEWLLSCQHRQVHLYTRAEPGGWAWSNLPGAVPDADDTAGALLALYEVSSQRAREKPTSSGWQPQGQRPWGWLDSDHGPILVHRACHPQASLEAATRVYTPSQGNAAAVIEAVCAGVDWLLGLQNRDGGIPTFCRGWTKLPFDKSSPDITAHAFGAMGTWLHELPDPLRHRTEKAMGRAARYLREVQRKDGSWVPLWFGNQHAPEQENPVYGTSRALTHLFPLPIRPETALLYVRTSRPVAPLRAECRRRLGRRQLRYLFD